MSIWDTEWAQPRSTRQMTLAEGSERSSVPFESTVRPPGRPLHTGLSAGHSNASVSGLVDRSGAIPGEWASASWALIEFTSHPCAVPDGGSATVFISSLWV